MRPVLGNFAGLWQVERVIDDRLGVTGQFRGEARFAAVEDGLDYHEAGLIYIGTAVPMRAERRYQWRSDGQGGIAVLFEDGRSFHRFDPQADVIEDSHDCPPDMYHVRYAFTDWPVWSSTWRVRGPRKDYEMRSTYRKAPIT